MIFLLILILCGMDNNVCYPILTYTNILYQVQYIMNTHNHTIQDFLIVIYTIYLIIHYYTAILKMLNILMKT